MKVEPHRVRASKRATKAVRPRLRLTDLPPTITVEQAGELLSLSRSAAYRAVQRGEIRAFRMNGKLKVPTAPLLEMLGR